MAKKRFSGVSRVCPSCGAKIENNNINYCLKCNNVFWSKTMYKGGARIVK